MEFNNYIKLMNLLKRQDQVSPMRPMPVDDKGNASQVTSVTGETINLFYYDGSDVLTADAGQAAGTLVQGKLVYDNIKNQSGAFEGTWKDTSFSFTSGVFVSTQQKFFNFTAAEGTDDVGGTARLAAICAGFANGDWCLDHTTGIVYGKKATTGTTLAAGAYKVMLPVTGSGGPTANVNINQVGGVSTNVGAGAATTGTMRVAVGTTTPQAYGQDATGADTYATIVTAGGSGASHIAIFNAGAKDAIISLNSGTTDMFYVPGLSVATFDAVTIAAGATIQAKNGVAGQNYTNLSITIW